MIYPGNSEHPRPAFNLGKGEIVFASSAEGGKTDADTDSNLTAVGDWSGNTWKLTLRDSSRSFRASADKANAKPGETISINYSGAKTGDNEYVSAIIMCRYYYVNTIRQPRHLHRNTILRHYVKPQHFYALA